MEDQTAMNENSQRIKDALSKTQLELKQLENASYEAALSGDTKKEKEIREEIKLLNGRISTLQGMTLNTAPSTAEVKNPNWGGMPEVKKDEIKYSYEPFDKELNVNQWVIEIHKDKPQGYENFKELERALYRLKEKKLAFFALLHYIGDNNDRFCMVLYNTGFQKEYDFSRSAYTDAMNAMFYYGLIVPTYRKKINKKEDVSCRIFIFNANLDPKTLPKEPFCPTNKQHMEIVRNIKRSYNMRVND